MFNKENYYIENKEKLKEYRKRYHKKNNNQSEANHLARGNHCELSKESIEWINGELLGDGCIYAKSVYSAIFIYTSKYLEYIQYVSDTLNSFGIKQMGIIRENYTPNKTYLYQSRYYAELLPIRKKWYPNGKKIIPKHLPLTSLTCRQWYIGDGFIKNINYNYNPYIILCTYGFSIPDVEWLIKKLIKLGFRATRPSNNSIHISTYSTKAFIDYIGRCPVDCYQYKFNYLRKKNERKNNQKGK